MKGTSSSCQDYVTFHCILRRKCQYYTLSPHPFRWKGKSCWLISNKLRSAIYPSNNYDSISMTVILGNYKRLELQTQYCSYRPLSKLLKTPEKSASISQNVTGINRMYNAFNIKGHRAPIISHFWRVHSKTCNKVTRSLSQRNSVVIWNMTWKCNQWLYNCKTALEYYLM